MKSNALTGARSGNGFPSSTGAAPLTYFATGDPFLDGTAAGGAARSDLQRAGSTSPPSRNGASAGRAPAVSTPPAPPDTEATEEENDPAHYEFATDFVPRRRRRTRPQSKQRKIQKNFKRVLRKGGLEGTGLKVGIWLLIVLLSAWLISVLLLPTINGMMGGSSRGAAKIAAARR